jgi:hypothetical protein
MALICRVTSVRSILDQDTTSVKRKFLGSDQSPMNMNYYIRIRFDQVRVGYGLAHTPSNDKCGLHV